MKHALKAAFLMVVGAVLLAAVYSRLCKHQVPHPHAAKVFLAGHVVPQQASPVAQTILATKTVGPTRPIARLATVAILAAEHLIAIGFVATSGVVALPKTEQSSCCQRGPPLGCPLDVR